MKQPQKADAKAEAQRHRRLRLPCQRGVVNTELLKRAAQVFVFLVVYGKQPRKDHWLGFAIAWQRLLAGPFGIGERVSDLHVSRVLKTGDHIADLAHPELG